MRYISIIVGLLAVIGVLIFLLWQLARTRDQLSRTDSVLSEKTDSIRYWKSRSGKTVATKQAAEISAKDLENHYSGLAAELKDIKVKVSSLKAVLRASIEANGQGVPIIVRDTVRIASGTESRDSLFVNDGYLDFRSSISFTEDAGYKYTYSDSILFALVRKRKGWFGKESLYGEVRMSNPHARSLNQTSILIRERQKRFNVSIGAGYDPFTNQVRPGIYVGYSLIRL